MPQLLLKSDGNSVTYANPNEPARTFRVKQTSSPKSIDGVPVVNHVTEFILLDKVDHTIGEKTIRDSISVRLRVSGATESEEAMNLLLNRLGFSVEQWRVDADGHVLVGFSPPSEPAVSASYPGSDWT